MPASPPPDWPPVVWPAGQPFLIDPQRSVFRVHLTPTGPLKAFGHAHVIGSEALSGRLVLAEPWTESVFSIAVDIDDFLVDPPNWRAEAGLEPNLPDAAIDGTRANMRSETQLNATAHPVIRVQSLSISGDRPMPEVEVLVSVAGQVSTQTLPMLLHWEADQLIGSGVASWQLSKLGIEPFSALGGGLRVADDIEISYRIYAVSGKDQSIGD